MFSEALDGDLLGWQKAMNRWSVLAGGLGFLVITEARSSPSYAYAAIAASAGVILVAQHGQGLHNRAAGSVVIRVQKWTWAGGGLDGAVAHVGCGNRGYVCGKESRSSLV